MTLSSNEPGLSHWDLATWRLTRRRFLQRTAGLGLGLSLAGVAAACGGESEGDGGAAAEGQGGGSETLSVLSWEGYHRQPWLADLERDTGITVNVTNVGSTTEMFSRTKANPSQFDLVLNTAGLFTQYVGDDLLIPVDESRVPNVKLISDAFPWRDATTVDGKNYGILYNWGDQPLGWNSAEVPGSYDIGDYVDDEGNPADWNILWDPQFKGKVIVFDGPQEVGSMIPLALGITDPYNLDEQEFEAFRKKLFDLRPQVKRLTSGFTDQVNAFVGGEGIIGYINIAQVIVDANAEGTPLVANHLVKNGVPAWSDNYSITKEGGAKKLDAVYEFINATLEVPWQARFIAETGNSGVLDYELATSEEAKAADLTEEKLDVTLIPQTREGDVFFQNMLFFQTFENLDKRLEAWEEFKLGIGT